MGMMERNVSSEAGKESPKLESSVIVENDQNVNEVSNEEKEIALNQRKAEDGSKIEELRNELIGKPERKDFEVLNDWVENETKKINEKAKQMEGSSDNAIGGRKENFDRRGALISLEDYKELKFIQHAIKEGSTEEVNYALKLVNIYYRDRDDLKSSLIEKSKI